jgi:HD-GYP domain-containing protein (c-di-GMP phosphodiesterase class II)
MNAVVCGFPDTLRGLNRNAPLPEKIRAIHQALQDRLGDIDRLAVALYDAETDLVKTFVDSSGGDRPLVHYQARLSDCHSLREIVRTAAPRVVNDLTVFGRAQPHTRQLLRHGYRSSYTLPMYHGGTLLGFLFFDSLQQGRFDAPTLEELEVFGHLAILVVVHELSRLRVLTGAVKAARDLTHHRDSDTGAHLERMAYYARLIARHLPAKYGLDDSDVETLFLLAPLHDVGKIGLPDSILRKDGRLTEQEFELMKTHTTRGRDIVDTLAADFDLTGLEEVETMRNIAALHHEALNGSGYPLGLMDGQIPLEARIVAVADVFDALTTRRPYKRAWSNQEAFAMLDQLAGVKLDRECVAALVSHPEEVEEIQARFREDRCEGEKGACSLTDSHLYIG